MIKTTLEKYPFNEILLPSESKTLVIDPRCYFKVKGFCNLSNDTREGIEIHSIRIGNVETLVDPIKFSILSDISEISIPTCSPMYKIYFKIKNVSNKTITFEGKIFGNAVK